MRKKAKAPKPKPRPPALVVMAHSKASKAQRNTLIPKKEFEAALKAHLPKVKCSQYLSSHKPAVFTCLVHKKTWKTTPYQILKNKHGCPKCESESAETRRKTHHVFVKELKQVSPDIKVIGRYTKSNEPLRVRCGECDHSWLARPNNLLHAKSGCPECYRASPPVPVASHEKMRLGKRVVKVQGYEKRVIELLISKGFNPEVISVFSEGSVPTIQYTLDKKQRSYWPDLKVRDTLVEVKSTWTLFRYWKANVAKAKATVKQGHKLKVIVSDGKRFAVLPDNWHSLKELEVKAVLAKKFVKAVRVLSFDPGVSNFAWSVVEVRRPFAAKVVASGMLYNTVKTFSDDLQRDVADFLSEVTSLFTTYKPDHFIMERFQARGMKGTTIELVNLMLGAFLSWLTERQFSFKHRVKLITASQWKNEWNRNSDLDKIYKRTSVVPHQVDAVGIALYGAYYWFKDKPFANIKKLESKIVKEIDSTNDGHEINRKTRVKK